MLAEKISVIPKMPYCAQNHRNIQFFCILQSAQALNPVHFRTLLSIEKILLLSVLIGFAACLSKKARKAIGGRYSKILM